MDCNVTYLGDLSIDGGKYGIAAPAVEYDPQFPAYLRISDINDDGTLNTTDRKSVADPSAKNYMLKRGDIVFARTGGSTGRNYYYDERDGNFAFAGFLIKFSLDPTRVNPRFIKYYTQSKPYWNWIRSFNTGSTRGNINAKTLANMPIPLPSQPVQNAIVSICDSISEKIRLNNRLNGYLEELLFAKYDELFPAESEHDGTLADIGTVVGGATPSKKRAEYYCENGIGWITPRDLSNSGDKFIAQGAVDLTEEGYSSCSVKLLPAGSVLFSSRAPIGYVAIAAANVTTNQGFKSIVPKEEFGTAFVYCFLVRNKKKIADMGAGTTFPEVSGSMMRSVPLSLPSGQLCAEFSAFAHPILEQQRSFELENRNLCLLRDTLLPKLMSGKIDVSKVDLTQLNSHLADC